MSLLFGRLLPAALALIAFAPWTAARALTYPSKPVTLIVPLAAGTGMDSLARLYGEQLQALGKPVVIENKPGAAQCWAPPRRSGGVRRPHHRIRRPPQSRPIKLYKKTHLRSTGGFRADYFYVKSPFVLVVDPKPINTVPG
jgi:hypothetical protein